jgi:hypothetical protein
MASDEKVCQWTVSNETCGAPATHQAETTDTDYGKVLYVCEEHSTEVATERDYVTMEALDGE